MDVAGASIGKPPICPEYARAAKHSRLSATNIVHLRQCRSARLHSYATLPLVSKNTRSEAESVRLTGMAFGQQSGPPASARQIKELLTLLNEAGHSDFRDARGPMGFTQRQAAGKFTRDEANAFIESLQESDSDGNTAVAPGWRQSAQEQLMRHLPADQLAAELRRRGWTVAEP